MEVNTSGRVNGLLPSASRSGSGVGVSSGRVRDTDSRCAAATIRSRTCTASSVVRYWQLRAASCRIVSAVRFHRVHVDRVVETASTTHNAMASASSSARSVLLERVAGSAAAVTVVAQVVGSWSSTPAAVVRHRSTDSARFGAFLASRVVRVRCWRIRLTAFADGRFPVRSTWAAMAVSTAASMSQERWE